jgi:hypothetical protein
MNEDKEKGLLLCVRVNNEMAREALTQGDGNGAQKYHEICRNHVEQIINGPYDQKTRAVLQYLKHKGSGIGCDKCQKLGNYVKGLLEGDISLVEETERVYEIPLKIILCCG